MVLSSSRILRTTGNTANELVCRRLADGRQEDLLQAIADAGVRGKLLKENGI